MATYVLWRGEGVGVEVVGLWGWGCGEGNPEVLPFSLFSEKIWSAVEALSRY